MRDRAKVGGRRKDRGERQSQGRRKKGKTEVRDRAKVGGRKERQR